MLFLFSFFSFLFFLFYVGVLESHNKRENELFFSWS
jgi:hypothetical protein